jgi:ABC-type amino acid transport substrate-binding protein
MKDGLPAGVEVDLANELGYALKRPVEFIPLRQNAQFATLVVNQVDILMTGLVMPTNATPNVVFTPPYSTNGPLVWAIRSADKDLRLDISKHLAIWYVDGTINRILKKWNLPPTAPTQMIVVPKHVSTNALPNAMELQPVNDRRTR